MKTTININDTVICKPTEDGWETFREYYRNLGLDPEIYVKVHTKDLDDNQIKMQLYRLMHIFGNEMYILNNKQMFVENKLVVEKL